MSTINLHQLIPTYRRDTEDVTGAVRMSAIEMVGMEQMPGGRFQITARTVSSTDYYLSESYPSLTVGRQKLEAFRAMLGGEEPLVEALPVVPVLRDEFGNEIEVDATESSTEANAESTELAFDPGPEGPLFFTVRKTVRRSRCRHRNAPGRDVRALRPRPVAQLALVA